MAKTKLEIKQEIKSHISNCGVGQYGWYIGIAESPRLRLFSDHNVEEKNDAWIFREAANSDTAREIEVELIKELKTKGDDGGGSDKTKFVYAYKITTKTKE